MIEIFLNPDEDTIGGEAMETKSSSDERGNNTDLIVFYSADKIIKVRKIYFVNFYYKKLIIYFN